MILAFGVGVGWGEGHKSVSTSLEVLGNRRTGEETKGRRARDSLMERDSCCLGVYAEAKNK